ncbi:signal recognition particle-docking protein FtsY [Calothrix sp. NIES-4071]|nr:signal recognition particle-docking protein FtsY [Calothrix sp. NIES-4071]BAZ61005.1 signal recognition particle-docking protein FtsY [Calothrix sp. NIES-4105]
MAFNWFRRQHNESSNTPSQEESKIEQQVEAPSSNAAPSTDTTPAASDLLAFAKAAYKNIQQKQQDTPEETSTVESGNELSAQKAPVEASNIEEVVTETATVINTVAENTDDTVESTVVVAEVNDGASQNAAANLSFIERAAAERKARQERLMQNAIDVPAPETEITNVVSDTNDGEVSEDEIEETSYLDSDLEFDEGFVWSAEVLAAQGRRPEDVSVEEINWLKKLRRGLSKTRRNIVNQLKAIVGKGPLNQAAVTEIEALLLQADVGVEATDYIIDALQTKLRSEALPADAAIAYLKTILKDMLEAPMQKSQKTVFAPEKDILNIWLITGVNGAGKTTTIGKLAHLSQKSGYRTLIGAADTFRAAAVEQVKVWGTRSNVEVISNPGKNTDPAAVVFDAIAAANARSTELLLVDTAGRLQNKKNLMEELSKVRRIIDKKAPKAKVESLLVLDATLGQNGLRQAEVFSEAAQLSGVVLTKLDGTAKGGVALAVVKQLGLPIRFIGAGEGIEDLRPFSSYEFVEALLSN